LIISHLDYLAEVSLSIMAIQKERDPKAGFARDFLEVVRSLIPFWKKGSKTRIVTNAGGLNPHACARACSEILRKESLSLKIAVVSGDNVLDTVRLPVKNSSIFPRKSENELEFSHLETGESIQSVSDYLVTANAYLGADPLVKALNQGADLVITGRVADPSLTVAPCIAHFNWDSDDLDPIAGATIAGHLIECGTQVTGGFSTDWLKLPNHEDIGFPIAEVSSDGSCVITKPKGTGGAVTVQTVKEQLLYEIGDPGKYLSPDLTVSFLNLKVEKLGKDRVQVSGGSGSAATDSYKVSATYRDGFKAHGTLTIFGQNAVKKAKECGKSVLDRLKKAGYRYRNALIECLGTGASQQGMISTIPESAYLETVLRISVSDSNREAVERFTKEMMPLITAGPQGVTGYAAGRPKVQPIFSYWPCLIPKKMVTPMVEMVE
jgi:hypothetical protein